MAQYCLVMLVSTQCHVKSISFIPVIPSVLNTRVFQLPTGYL